MADQIDKNLIQEQASLVKELRETLEAKDAGSAVQEEKISKINSRLDDIESVGQKHFALVEESKKRDDEIKSQLDQLEKEVARSYSSKGKTDEKSEAYKSFSKYLARGEKSLTADDVKYLRTDSNTDGGYLCPPDYFNEIIKKITEISPVRQVARVSQTTREAVLIPKRQTLLDAFWVGEGGDKDQDNSTFGKEEIKVNKLSVVVPITEEMLEDSVFNIEQEVNTNVSERFAQKEGDAFLNGDGVNKPEGILVASGVPEINSGIANSFDANDLIRLTGELKTGYDGVFMFNRRTLATIRQFTGGDGQYLWHMFDSAAPGTLLGHRYLIAEDMPDIGTDTYPVLFGDFQRGYRIIDRSQMMAVRDDSQLAINGLYRYVFRRRLGAQVDLEEAFVKLKCAL